MRLMPVNGQSDATTEISGTVATTPRYLPRTEGLEVVSFRLYAPKYPRTPHGGGGYINQYVVCATGPLARKVHATVSSGDTVKVTGSFRELRWSSGQYHRTIFELTLARITRSRKRASTVLAPAPSETPLSHPTK